MWSVEDFFNSAWGFSVAPFWSPTEHRTEHACTHATDPSQRVCRRNGLYFQTPQSGLLHWSSDGVFGDRLSAYRILDGEVVGFEDGGSLEWRVGDEEPKCTRNSTPATAQGLWPIGTCRSAADLKSGCRGAKVNSYAWVYHWATADANSDADSTLHDA